jgi:hypothetical protein
MLLRRLQRQTWKRSSCGLRCFSAEKSLDEEAYFRSLTEGFSVQIKNTTHKGRGLFATRPFKEGEVVYKEKSLASVLISPLEAAVQENEDAIFCAVCKTPLCVNISTSDELSSMGKAYILFRFLPYLHSSFPPSLPHFRPFLPSHPSHLSFCPFLHLSLIVSLC